MIDEDVSCDKCDCTVKEYQLAFGLCSDCINRDEDRVESIKNEMRIQKLVNDSGEKSVSYWHGVAIVLAMQLDVEINRGKS